MKGFSEIQILMLLQILVGLACLLIAWLCPFYLLHRFSGIDDERAFRLALLLLTPAVWLGCVAVQWVAVRRLDPRGHPRRRFK